MIKPRASIATKQALYEKCQDYLYTNFHKFSQNNKIKIALEIVKKNAIMEIGSSKLIIQYGHRRPPENIETPLELKQRVR